jgi:hypothetical protein
MLVNKIPSLPTPSLGVRDHFTHQRTGVYKGKHFVKIWFLLEIVSPKIYK